MFTNIINGLFHKKRVSDQNLNNIICDNKNNHSNNNNKDNSISYIKSIISKISIKNILIPKCNLKKSGKVIDEAIINNKQSDISKKFHKESSIYNDIIQSELIKIPPDKLLNKIFIELKEKAQIDDDIDNYSFHCKNSSENLKKFIQPVSEKQNLKDNNLSISSCKPPEFHGLDNSNIIIPSYYNFAYNIKNGLLDVDYLFIIKDDIRNLRRINNYQIYYIKKLPDEIKNEIIDELIISIHYARDFISELKSIANTPTNSYTKSMNNLDLKNSFIWEES